MSLINPTGSSPQPLQVVTQPKLVKRTGSMSAREIKALFDTEKTVNKSMSFIDSLKSFFTNKKNVTAQDIKLTKEEKNQGFEKVVFQCSRTITTLKQDIKQLQAELDPHQRLWKFEEFTRDLDFLSQSFVGLEKVTKSPTIQENIKILKNEVENARREIVKLLIVEPEILRNPSPLPQAAASANVNEYLSSFSSPQSPTDKGARSLAAFEATLSQQQAGAPPANVAESEAQVIPHVELRHSNAPHHASVSTSAPPPAASASAPPPAAKAAGLHKKPQDSLDKHVAAHDAKAKKRLPIVTSATHMEDEVQSKTAAKTKDVHKKMKEENPEAKKAISQSTTGQTQGGGAHVPGQGTKGTIPQVSPKATAKTHAVSHEAVAKTYAKTVEEGKPKQEKKLEEEEHISNQSDAQSYAGKAHAGEVKAKVAEQSAKLKEQQAAKVAFKKGVTAKYQKTVQDKLRKSIAESHPVPHVSPRPAAVPPIAHEQPRMHQKSGVKLQRSPEGKGREPQEKGGEVASKEALYDAHVAKTKALQKEIDLKRNELGEIEFDEAVQPSKVVKVQEELDKLLAEQVKLKAQPVVAPERHVQIRSDLRQSCSKLLHDAKQGAKRLGRENFNEEENALLDTITTEGAIEDLNQDPDVLRDLILRGTKLIKNGYKKAIVNLENDVTRKKEDPNLHALNLAAMKVYYKEIKTDIANILTNLEKLPQDKEVKSRLDDARELSSEFQSILDDVFSNPEIEKYFKGHDTKGEPGTDYEVIMEYSQGNTDTKLDAKEVHKRLNEGFTLLLIGLEKLTEEKMVVIPKTKVDFQEFHEKMKASAKRLGLVEDAAPEIEDEHKEKLTEAEIKANAAHIKAKTEEFNTAPETKQSERYVNRGLDADADLVDADVKEIYGKKGAQSHVSEAEQQAKTDAMIKREAYLAKYIAELPELKAKERKAELETLKKQRPVTITADPYARVDDALVSKIQARSELKSKLATHKARIEGRPKELTPKEVLNEKMKALKAKGEEVEQKVKGKLKDLVNALSTPRKDGKSLVNSLGKWKGEASEDYEPILRLKALVEKGETPTDEQIKDAVAKIIKGYTQFSGGVGAAIQPLRLPENINTLLGDLADLMKEARKYRPENLARTLVSTERKEGQMAKGDAVRTTREEAKTEYENVSKEGTESLPGDLAHAVAGLSKEYDARVAASDEPKALQEVIDLKWAQMVETEDLSERESLLTEYRELLSEQYESKAKAKASATPPKVEAETEPKVEGEKVHEGTPSRLAKAGKFVKGAASKVADAVEAGFGSAIHGLANAIEGKLEFTVESPEADAIAKKQASADKKLTEMSQEALEKAKARRDVKSGELKSYPAFMGKLAASHVKKAKEMESTYHEEERQVRGELRESFLKLLDRAKRGALGLKPSDFEDAENALLDKLAKVGVIENLKWEHPDFNLKISMDTATNLIRDGYKKAIETLEGDLKRTGLDPERSLSLAAMRGVSKEIEEDIADISKNLQELRKYKPISKARVQRIKTRLTTNPKVVDNEAPTELERSKDADADLVPSAWEKETFESLGEAERFERMELDSKSAAKMKAATKEFEVRENIRKLLTTAEGLGLGPRHLTPELKKALGDVSSDDYDMTKSTHQVWEHYTKIIEWARVGFDEAITEGLTKPKSDSEIHKFVAKAQNADKAIAAGIAQVEVSLAKLRAPVQRVVDQLQKVIRDAYKAKELYEGKSYLSQSLAQNTADKLKSKENKRLQEMLQPEFSGKTPAEIKEAADKAIEYIEKGFTQAIVDSGTTLVVPENKAGIPREIRSELELLKKQIKEMESK